MSTTAVIVEHLIAGLHALLWMLLVSVTVLGHQWIDFDRVKDISTILTLVVLAVAYPIGIFIDEAADFLLDKVSKRIRNRRFSQYNLDPSNDNLTAFLLLQGTDNEFVRSYFNYIRMRIRVSRCAFINFALLIVAAIIFVAASGKASWVIMSFVVLVGTMLAGLALWSWYRFSDLFAKQVSRMYQAKQQNG